MKNYPETIMEFEKNFNSEEACRGYLFNLRWLDGFRCPRCNHEKAWLLKNALYECAKCNHKVSVMAGTIFHRTHKPLILWLELYGG